MSFSPEYLDRDRGPSIIASIAIVTSVAAIFVIVRVSSRYAILKKLGHDDWLLVAATFLAVLNTVVVTQSVNFGTGRHIQVVPESNIIPESVCRLVARVLYPLTIGVVKLSICFLYLKLFSSIRNATLVLIAIVSGASIAHILVTTFQCDPMESLWDAASYPDAFCVNNSAFQYTMATINVITDTWILILPISTILSLQIPTGKKIVLIGLFSVRVFACVAGIIRIAFLSTFLTSKDPTWDAYSISIVSGLEIAVAIITASIPGLKPIFDKVSPTIFPWTRARSFGSHEAVYAMGSSRDVEQALNTRGKDIESTDEDYDSGIDLGSPGFGFDFGFSDSEE